MNAIPVFSACTADLEAGSASAVSGYCAANMSVLNYARGFTLWLYWADTVVAVDVAGFFNSAAPMVARGDVMLVLGNDLTVGMRIVVSASDGAVVVLPLKMVGV